MPCCFCVLVPSIVMKDCDCCFCVSVPSIVMKDCDCCVCVSVRVVGTQFTRAQGASLKSVGITGGDKVGASASDGSVRKIPVKIIKISVTFAELFQSKSEQGAGMQ